MSIDIEDFEDADDWADLYCPIDSGLNHKRRLHATLLDDYGDDLQYVRTLDEAYVWTLFSSGEGDFEYIEHGRWGSGALSDPVVGFLVTEHPVKHAHRHTRWALDVDLDLLDEDDDEDEDDEDMDEDGDDLCDVCFEEVSADSDYSETPCDGVFCDGCMKEHITKCKECFDEFAKDFESGEGSGANQDGNKNDHEKATQGAVQYQS